jgi:hypothetical protein
MAVFPRAGVLALLVVLLATASLVGCDGGSEAPETSEVPLSSQTTIGSQSSEASQATSGSQTTRSSQTGGPTVTANRDQFTRDNWGVLAVDPDAHKGASVDIVGRLLQDPVRRDDGAYWQMYADPKNYDWNSAVQYVDPSIPVGAGDFVHVTGTVKGALEGENSFGENVTLVDILAETAEVVDVMAAASPAEHVALIDASIDQHGLVITLERVEYAADETRVFLNVKNGSTETASLYELQLATAVQGGNIYDTEALWDYYPTVEWELQPGTDSSGVIVFPPLDPSQAVDMRMNAGLDDYTLDFEPYLFEVPAE